jgi:hypothetical protein
MAQRNFETTVHGQAIRGTVYHVAEQDATRRRPTVVMLHGFTGNRVEAGFLFVYLGRELVRRGINAVTFDFCGSGESDGSFDEMLVSGELADALHMLDWTAGQPFADRGRIGLLGFSLGGLVGACAAARRRWVRAIALLAPTTVSNLSRFAGEQAEPPIVVGPHTLRREFFDDLRTLEPTADLAMAGASGAATLIVQGTADTAVPPAVSDAYVEALRGGGAEPEYVAIDGANHAFAEPAHRKRVVDAAAGFFERELRRR